MKSPLFTAVERISPQGFKSIRISVGARHLKEAWSQLNREIHIAGYECGVPFLKK
jgi:hypothetical protein